MLKHETRNRHFSILAVYGFKAYSNWNIVIWLQIISFDSIDYF